MHNAMLLNFFDHECGLMASPAEVRGSVAEEMVEEIASADEGVEFYIEYNYRICDAWME